MQLGVVGLGRMGGNIARRLMQGGHACVVYDRDAKGICESATDTINADAYATCGAVIGTSHPNLENAGTGCKT